MENLPLDFVSVVVAAAVESLSSILVLLGLLFLVTKGQVLKLLIFRLVFHSRKPTSLSLKVYCSSHLGLKIRPKLLFLTTKVLKREAKIWLLKL